MNQPVTITGGLSLLWRRTPEVSRPILPLRFGLDGLAKRGLLVRHLLMPGQGEEAAEIFRWLADEVSPDTYLNIMGQYRPEYQVGQPDSRGNSRYDDIRRRPLEPELKEARRAARAAGLWRFDKRWTTAR